MKSRSSSYEKLDSFLEKKFIKLVRNKENVDLFSMLFSNQSSLSERLKNLFDLIDELNQTKIFSDCDRELLITKLAQTRNYYTHGDSKDKYPKMITDVHEMYETKLLLQEVLRYYIYQELDMKYRYKNF